MASIELTQEELEKYVGVEVLKIVGPERQRELLVAAIEEVAESYSCRSAVDQVVKAALAEAVRESLKEPEMAQRIMTLGRQRIEDVIGAEARTTG